MPHAGGSRHNCNDAHTGFANRVSVHKGRWPASRRFRETPSPLPVRAGLPRQRGPLRVRRRWPNIARAAPSSMSSCLCQRRTGSTGCASRCVSLRACCLSSPERRSCEANCGRGVLSCSMGASRSDLSLVSAFDVHIELPTHYSPGCTLPALAPKIFN
jgi:hypothetical protein